MALPDLGLPTLSIEGEGPLTRGAVVKLDGHEVSGLRSLQLHMATDEISAVTLTLDVDRVDVSAEVLAALQAIVRDGAAVQ